MQYLLPIVVVLLAWWVSTAALLYRCGLPRPSYRATFLGATVIMVIGIGAIVVSRDQTGPGGAYLAFLGALSVWAWHEVSYLFGFVNGPRAAPCPDGCRGWRRFVLGVQTCVYHELAVVATAAGIAGLTWSSPNRVALGAFLVLWLMRWSAKLNIFLGVRNLHAEFWPAHLDYLKSFVGRRPMNELFPVSMLLAALAMLALGDAARTAAASSGERTGALLLLTLLALAVVEHVCLVLRVPDELLWRPALRGRDLAGSAGGDGSGSRI